VSPIHWREVLCGGAPVLSKPWELGGDAKPCCVPGTDSHIPPEWYARGAYRADPMTVWQVGVLLYEMLTGHVPFQTSTEIIWKKLPRIESDISPSETHIHTRAFIHKHARTHTRTHTRTRTHTTCAHTHTQPRTHKQQHDLALEQASLQNTRTHEQHKAMHPDPQPGVHIVTRLVSSPDCKDFLKRCLTKRALGRPLLQSLLLHPWLRGARRL
jgi:serine/threonine protein kinase